MKNINALKQSQLVSFMSDDDLAILLNAGSLVNYKAGESIFMEGEYSHDMFVILSGEIEISVHMGAGERALKILGAGECFGEMGVISKEVRSASARVFSNAQCLVISHNEFDKLLDSHSQFTKGFLKLLVERIKHSEKRSNNAILEAYHSVLFSLSNLAETRDNETGSHLFRVREYCKKLAEKLAQKPEYKAKINPHFIDNIYIVAPTHDIGKVAIADSILLKPGKLDEEEFKIMKQHAHFGGRILSRVLEDINFPTFKMAFNVANYHHERFDGNGYPDGLKGEEIPIEARIMAVADVFDALLSKRVYKPAFEKSIVKSIIQEEKGQLFDPVIATILLDDFDEFVTIYQHYSD